MKQRYFLASLAMTNLVLILSSARVAAQENCIYLSYMRLPDGKCLDLSYLTSISANRQIGTQANSTYQEVLNINTALESNLILPQIDIEDQRSVRQEALLNIENTQKNILREINNANDFLYVFQIEAMAIVGEAFSP